MRSYTINSLEDAYAVVRHYGLEHEEFGAGTAAGFADTLFILGATDLDAFGLAELLAAYIEAANEQAAAGASHDEFLAEERRSLEDVLNQAMEWRQRLVDCIRRTKLGSNGGAIWRLVAELSTSVSPAARLRDEDVEGLLLGVVQVFTQLGEFVEWCDDSLGLRYTPGASELMDELLRRDIEEFDATLSKAVPWPGREPDWHWELAAILRLVTNAEFAAQLASLQEQYVTLEVATPDVDNHGLRS